MALVNFERFFTSIFYKAFTNSRADNGLKNGLSYKFSAKAFFWLLLPWMGSLLDAVYETSIFFQITESDDVIFVNN